MLRERLSCLSRASRRVNESLDFDAVLQGVLDSARSLRGGQNGRHHLPGRKGAAAGIRQLGPDPGGAPAGTGVLRLPGPTAKYERCQGAGGPHGGRNPGGSTVRIGGRVPWGGEVEFAYTTVYDSRGQASVNHIVDERGYGVMLNKPDSAGA